MAEVNPIQLQKVLKGTDYPADKEQLLKQAEKNGADEDVRSMLEKLPNDKFQTPAEVSQAVGKLE